MYDCACEQISRAAEHEKRNKNTNSNEHQQLYNTLEGNSSHHTLMSFIGIQLAGSEYGGENSHGDSNPEPWICQYIQRVARHFFTEMRQRIDTESDSLELKRNIGNDTENCHNRYHNGKRLAFAVAGRYEIGNTGNMLIFGNQYHFPKQHIP